MMHMRCDLQSMRRDAESGRWEISLPASWLIGEAVTLSDGEGVSCVAVLRYLTSDSGGGHAFVAELDMDTWHDGT